MKTTKSQSKWWGNRVLDWKTSYLDTWNHPHRYLITAALNTFDWQSLMEMGVGGGANLKNIITLLKGKQVGGVDVSPTAIQFCEDNFKGGVFKVGSTEDLMMSDKSADVILSDMTYIYVGPFKIKKNIKELRRVARNRILLCEFYIKSPIQRLLLYLKSGYFAHNWPKLLKKYGFWDIVIMKLPKEAWPGGLQEKYCYLIKARPPKRIIN